MVDLEPFVDLRRNDPVVQIKIVILMGHMAIMKVGAVSLMFFNTDILA